MRIYIVMVFSALTACMHQPITGNRSEPLQKFEHLEAGDNLAGYFIGQEVSMERIDTMFRFYGAAADESVIAIQTDSEKDEWITITYHPRCDMTRSEARLALITENRQGIKMIVNRIIK